MISTGRPAQIAIGERPCSTCGRCEKNEISFFVHCCICDRLWHNVCLYTRVPHNEILKRNRKDSSGLGLGWKDWKCRQCRGVGPEGREHRRCHITIDLTLDEDDDEIKVLSPAVPAGPPTRQAAIPLAALPSPEPPPHPAPSQRQAPPRLPPPLEVIELDDDDDIIEILSPTQRPTLQIDAGSEPLIEPPVIQDEPMVDLNDLSIEERPPTPPPPEFPSFAKHVEVEHRFGPMDGTPRPGPSLPPALRANGRTALGQRMQDAITSDKLVQSLGLKGLKAAGWRIEKRERVDSIEPPVIPDWIPPNDKGKGRDPGERRPRSVTEFRLIPPRLLTTQIKSGSESYPPRKPRKSTVAVHRANTVKLEPVDLSFS